MAASKGQTSGPDVKLYHTSSFALPDARSGWTYDAINGSGKLVVEANEVKVCTDIGDVAKSANTSEYPVYGEDTRRTIAGPASLGTFSFTFALDRSDPKHVELNDAEIGTQGVIGIVTETGDEQISVLFFPIEIAGVTDGKPVDGAATVVVECAMTQKPLTVDES